MKVVGKDAMGTPLVEPDPPECEGPVVETVFIPEGEDFFTVERIIELAAKIFGFYDNFKKAGHGAKIKFNIYGNYNTIKKYVTRKLTDKDTSPQQKSNQSKLYSKEIVHEFLNNYSNQLYFLDKGVEGTKSAIEEYKQASGKGKAPKNQSAIEQLLKQLTELENRKTKLLRSSEGRARFVKEFSSFFDESAYTEENGVGKCKKQILFQFLFESLIEFDEELLRSDIELLPRIEDPLVEVEDKQIQAMLRILDLHNYYKGKIDLVDTFGKLLETKKAPKKSNYGTFKDSI